MFPDKSPQHLMRMYRKNGRELGKLIEAVMMENDEDVLRREHECAYACRTPRSLSSISSIIGPAESFTLSEASGSRCGGVSAAR